MERMSCSVRNATWLPFNLRNQVISANLEDDQGNPGLIIKDGKLGKIYGAEVHLVTDQTRQVVYVVDAQGVIGQKVVRPGRLMDGLRVIREGLDPRDRIVISGVQRARPGRKVTVKEGVVSAFPTGVSRGENSTLSLPALRGSGSSVPAETPSGSSPAPGNGSH
jgi:hypothetical protein